MSFVRCYSLLVKFEKLLEHFSVYYFLPRKIGDMGQIYQNFNISQTCRLISVFEGASSYALLLQSKL